MTYTFETRTVQTITIKTEVVANDGDTNEELVQKALETPLLPHEAAMLTGATEARTRCSHIILNGKATVTITFEKELS